MTANVVYAYSLCKTLWKLAMRERPNDCIGNTVSEFRKRSPDHTVLG